MFQELNKVSMNSNNDQASSRSNSMSGVLGFQDPIPLCELKTCMTREVAVASDKGNPQHWRRVTVVAGWRFNESVSGEPVSVWHQRYPQFANNSCCIWVELNLSVERAVLESASGKPTNNELLETSNLSTWHSHISDTFSSSSRIRELSSLTSAAALEVLPKLSAGLELYYIYCWEGVSAPSMVRAKAMQSALLLERALLAAFYQSQGLERFISRRLLRSKCFRSLIPVHWFDRVLSLDTALKAFATALFRENRFLFRLLTQTVSFPTIPSKVTDEASPPTRDHNPNDSSDNPPVADPAVTEFRYRSEKMPETLPSKRLLTSLLLPAGALPTLGLVDGQMAESCRETALPVDDFSAKDSDLSAKFFSLGGSMSIGLADSNMFAPPSRTGSEQHLGRSVNRPTLPQLKSLNLQRRRPAERREDAGGRTPEPAAAYDSHRTSSMSATPHENEECVSTQRSVKARKLDSGTPAPVSPSERPAGSSLALQLASLGDQFAEAPKPATRLAGRRNSLSSEQESSLSSSSSGSSSSILETEEQPPTTQFKASPQQARMARQLGGILSVPELGLSARREPLTEVSAGPPSRRSPEADRCSALIKYRFQCSEILPSQLYLSGEGVASSLDILQTHKVTHIVNSAGDTCPNYFPGKFHYLTFVLQDSRLTNETLEAVLFPALDFMQNAIESGGRLLVHCREGVSRSCTLVCAYLMCTQQLTFQSALDHVRSVREMCNPNTGFTFTLLKLGKRLHAAETGQPGIGDKKLSRVALHHLAAPFIVVLGVSLWEPTHQSWMPGGRALALDPRFYYVLRDQTTIYIWKGGAVPKHMEKLMRSAINRHIEDIKKYERISSDSCEIVNCVQDEEPNTFWGSLYLEGDRVPSTPVALNPALDEEAQYLCTEFPHVTVFDISEWIQQLQQSEASTDTPKAFCFLPPKSTPRTMEAVRRRHLGRHDSANLIKGSATHRVEMTPLYACAASRRVRNSLGLATPPSSHHGRRFSARPQLCQSGETPHTLPSSALQSSLHRTGEQSMDEPEEDYQSGFTRRSLLSVPQQSIAVGTHRASNGAGKDGKYETDVLYSFTYPNLEQGEGVDDHEILLDRSNDVILFVIFGQSALTPVQLPSQDEGDFDEMESAEICVEETEYQSTSKGSEPMFDSRTSRRNLTVPPIPLGGKMDLLPAAREIQPPATTNSKRPATAGQEFETLNASLQDSGAMDFDHEAEKEWETTIWLWEGLEADLKTDDRRDSIISSFCKLHSLDPHLLWVYSEKEGSETNKFLEMLFLL
eukprot:Gregarina_sp_Poly_1__4660@NODE_248_length_10720_cov_80_438937_g214_i1_p1_GENE_NODE_248_length_10720_cov_80_438937_g214_i1NODE_248_length_10720_cov_80_438937_g214_i1_p1_ORF_typecomplete_len1276_score198_18DSPc/PF00782_20/2_6e28CDKN3/PF05706_12/5_7e05Y_phosphatase/PF00102_27/0_00039Gelsolin/PF00626_22/3_3e02Gelsolin/PF00626_22/0_32Gelsolin/PF00626_22/1_4e03Init_tRNA_PT/PF04179_12/0_02Y_phosphatase2/PF03162_13/0_076_NODE_248_length_10720_cov_80_438937_g214_i11553982